MGEKLDYKYEIIFYDGKGNFTAMAQSPNFTDAIQSVKNWLDGVPNNSATIKAKLKKGA